MGVAVWTPTALELELRDKLLMTKVPSAVLGSSMSLGFGPKYPCTAEFCIIGLLLACCFFTRTSFLCQATCQEVQNDIVSVSFLLQPLILLQQIL